MYVSDKDKDKDKKIKEHKERDKDKDKDKDKIDKVKRKIFNSSLNEESMSPSKKKVKLVVDSQQNQIKKEAEIKSDGQGVSKEPKVKVETPEENVTPVVVESNANNVDSTHRPNGTAIDPNVT